MIRTKPDGTALVPVVNEDSIDPREELKNFYQFRKVFTAQIPDPHCYFIKASGIDMEPVILPNSLVLIQPIHKVTFPVSKELQKVTPNHPAMLSNHSYVALLHGDKLHIRQAVQCVNPDHNPLNVYSFYETAKAPDYVASQHILLPQKDKPVTVIGKVVEIINRY